MFRNPQKETERKLKLFRDSFLILISDGKYPQDRQQRLFQSSQRAGLDWNEARRYVIPEAKAFFENCIGRVISDGRVTQEELKDLYSLRIRLGLENEPVPMLARLYEVIELKIHTKIAERSAYLSNKTVVDGIKREIVAFGLPQDRTMYFIVLLEQQHYMAKMVIGDIPVVQASVSLYKDELCHLDISASFLESGSPPNSLNIGRLIITNTRIMFLSPAERFSYKWDDIKYCKMYDTSVYLKFANKDGFFFCHEPQTTATLIIGASRKYKSAQAKPSANKATPAGHKRLPDLSDGMDI